MKKIIITILTLALIATVFASCTKTEIETTTNPPVIEFPTEEVTSDEATTDVPVTEEVTTATPATEESTTEIPTTEVPTTQAPETTTKAPETTTKVPEITTKVPETTTKVPETTTKAPEPTTEAGPLKEEAIPEPTSKKEEDLNFMGSPVSPERAGLIYDGAGRLSSYDKIPEGGAYYTYDSNGVQKTNFKPYSKGNEPEPMRCEYCGKETKPYDGEHYGCYYGYCDRFLTSKTCPECGDFVQVNTCHSCK